MLKLTSEAVNRTVLVVTLTLFVGAPAMRAMAQNPADAAPAAAPSPATSETSRRRRSRALRSSIIRRRHRRQKKATGGASPTPPTEPRYATQRVFPGGASNP